MLPDTLPHPSAAMTATVVHPSLRHASHRGFTLIELLVAMAIAGLLAAVALPAYTAYVERARQQAVVTDLNQLQSLLARFQLDNGTFPPSLAAVGWNKADPWGEPYAYLPMAGANNGQKRKDRNLVPINTDFDLYSKGPDRNSVKALTARASRDDIIRAANGRYIGPATGF
jgi:general secretion pathway protein G